MTTEREKFDNGIEKISDPVSPEIKDVIEAALALERSLYNSPSTAKERGDTGQLFRLRKALEGIWGHELPVLDD